MQNVATRSVGRSYSALLAYPTAVACWFENASGGCALLDVAESIRQPAQFGRKHSVAVRHETGCQVSLSGNMEYEYLLCCNNIIARRIGNKVWGLIERSKCQQSFRTIIPDAFIEARCGNIPRTSMITLANCTVKHVLEPPAT